MFLNTLIQDLFKNNYQLFYKENEEITPLSTCFGFLRQIGGTAYIPIIINTDCVTDYDSKFQAICNMPDKGKLKASFTSIIFIGIFLSEKYNPELNNYCINNQVDFTENINYIKWYVDTSSKKILCGKNQPSKIDVIQECVSNAFKNQGLQPSDINTVYTRAKEENLSKIKSHNIILTISIILINLIVLIIMELNGGSKDTGTLMKFGAINSYNIYKLNEYYRLFTHIFLHIGWMHFLSNSLSLYIFGSRVEQYYGKFKFILIYILSGIAGGILSSLLENSIAAGASGAIFGLMGAVYNYIVINKTNMAGFDKYIINLFAIISIGTGFIIPGVSNMAHIGGFVFGFISAHIMNRICTD